MKDSYANSQSSAVPKMLRALLMGAAVATRAELGSGERGETPSELRLRLLREHKPAQRRVAAVAVSVSAASAAGTAAAAAVGAAAATAASGDATLRKCTRAPRVAA